MNFASRLSAAFNLLVGRKALGPDLLSALSLQLGSSARPSVHNMGEYLGRYADQAWVYRCIKVIQDKGAGVPLKVYKREGKNLVWQESHPLQVLLDGVNPFMSGVDLREATHGYYELTGNAYWLLDVFVDGKPTEIYPLNPSKVKINADKKKFVAGYVYEPTPGADPVALDAGTVLHFKTWNPLDEYYGLAPISAARDSSDSMMMADRYNKKFFENSAEAGGVLESAEEIDDATAKSILAKWKEVHQGYRKSHKIALLHSGLQFKPTTITHRDMMFPDLKTMTREDILAVYGVPPLMVGVFKGDDSADAKEQRRIFWKDTMIPRFAKFLSVVNERLAKPFDPNVFVAYDLSEIEELQDDAKLRAEIDEIHTRSGIRKINEVRASYNLDPVPWGNTWNAPLGVAPIDDRPEPEDEDPPEGGEEGDDPKKPPKKPKPDQMEDMETDEEKARRAAEKQSKDKESERRDAVWGVFKTFTERAETRWRPVLRGLFSDQEREVVRKIRDHEWPKVAASARMNGSNVKAAVDVFLFDEGEARRAWRKEGLKLYRSTLEASAEAEVAKYGLGSIFNVNDPRVVRWLESKAYKFAFDVNKTTVDALRDELSEAVKLGESIDGVEARVEKVFDLARGFRTERIARTEVVSASNAGAVQSYEQAGVQKVEWVDSRDDKVRESHQLDGTTRGIGAKFPNGLEYPGDPAGPPEEVINCRCTIAPVVERSASAPQPAAPASPAAVVKIDVPPPQREIDHVDKIVLRDDQGKVTGVKEIVHYKGEN